MKNVVVNMVVNVVLATVLTVLSSAVHANGWYLGLSYSSLDVDIEVLGSSEPLGMSLTAGYEFGSRFSVEASLGIGVNDSNIADYTDFSFELDSVMTVSAVGALPLSNRVGVYGKLGLALLNYSDSDGDTAEAAGIAWALGARCSLTDQLGLGLEYVAYPDGEYDDFTNDVEATTVNINISYHL